LCLPEVVETSSPKAWNLACSTSTCLAFLKWRPFSKPEAAQVADLVMTAWEARWRQQAQTDQGTDGVRGRSGCELHAEASVAQSSHQALQFQQPPPPPPPPRLIHSNLGSVTEVLAAARLPPRIRPAALAFGSLADGFVPLVAPAGAQPQPVHPAAPRAASPVTPRDQPHGFCRRQLRLVDRPGGRCEGTEAAGQNTHTAQQLESGGARAPKGEHHIGLVSVVMKAVQVCWLGWRIAVGGETAVPRGAGSRGPAQRLARKQE
jgi:hypothetical protein